MPFLLGGGIARAQCISGDCQNGTGIFIYPSGAKYVGQFRNGEIHGIGSCYYTDGSVYRGHWHQRYPEGKGTKTLSDGRSWSGQWLRGMPVDEQGNPLEVFPESKPDVYRAEEVVIQNGCLSGNCRDGFGVKGYPDGSRYEGDFQNGKPQGNGIFIYANGNWYRGEFHQGLRHGAGILSTEEGIKDGNWKEGEYSGKPDIVLGCIDGDCAEGVGTYIYKDAAAKYTGRFYNGLPHGEGIIIFSKGERYEGRFENGTFNGLGTFFPRNESPVSGIWKDGTLVERKQRQQELLATRTPVSEPEHFISLRNFDDIKIWAVIVGISTYSHMPTLRFTDDDAYRMYAFLKSPEGGAVSDDNLKLLIDEDATRSNILKVMNEVFTGADSNDLILVYYSGHGLKGSILPIDFDGYNNQIDYAEINEILKKGPAKYKLVLADACYAGSLLASKGTAESSNLLVRYFQSLSEAAPGTALILSSKSEEISLESSGLRQGVFSHYLIRGLKGEADSDNDRLVSVRELYDFINLNVRDYTLNRQNPLISGDYDPRMPVAVLR